MSNLPASYDRWRTAGPDDDAPTRYCGECRDETYADDWPTPEMCADCYQRLYCADCQEFRDSKTGRCVDLAYCELHPAVHLADDICATCDRIEGLEALQRECDKAYAACQDVYERVRELVADVDAAVPDTLIAGLDFSTIADAPLALQRLHDRAAELAGSEVK